MCYVITEICDETGSWINDFKIEITESLLIGIPISKGALSNNEAENIVFSKVKTDKFVVRKLSYIEQKVSYKLHTNRELRLMLSGNKPFSVFSMVEGDVFDIYNGQLFSNYSDVIRSRSEKIGDIIYEFKFLDNEGWRSDAYIALQSIRSYKGNSEGLELLEGELLGYTPEQNIEFIERFFSAHC